MTNMIAGDATTRLAQEGGVRAGRHTAQNNEACLVGGVVGLSQFFGPASSAAGIAPGPGPGHAPGSGVASSGPIATGVASGRGEKLPAEGASTSILAAGPGPGSAGASGDTSSADASPTSSSPYPATDQGAAGMHQTGAAPASSLTGGNGETGHGGAAPSHQASPALAVVAQSLHAAPEAAAQESLPQISTAFSGYLQANVSMSEHGATAFSQAGTYIEAIYNSIVFLGDNIAVANAFNFAPVSQLNQLAGFSGGAGDLAQLSNFAVTNNDATAVAIAGTWINHAYNSIIVVGTNSAVADAVNIAPVTQINMALFDGFDDASFGSIHESNLLLSDKDSTALAQAGIFVGNVGGSMAAETQLPSHGSNALFDEMPGTSNWSDLVEA